MEEIKISAAKVSAINGTQAPILPKYSSGVINSASGFARATRPANVGMVSQEIQAFCEDSNYPGHTLDDWKKWHLEHHENGSGINRAIDEAWNKFNEMRDSLRTVEKSDIQKWMEDLVYNKTYDGLMVQKTIIETIADKLGVTRRLANAEEEQNGIDGFINGRPVQIKSETYKQTGKKHNEATTCPVVYYRKENKNIIFEFDKAWFGL